MVPTGGKVALNLSYGAVCEKNHPKIICNAPYHNPIEL